MVPSVLSLGYHAYRVLPVTVEVHLLPGTLGMQILGLADSALKESRERIRSALLNSGYSFPVKQITVNLLPADIKKEGGQLELAVLTGILVASGEISHGILDRHIFLGSLSLDGSVRDTPRLVSALLHAAKYEKRIAVIPAEAADMAAMIPGLRFKTLQAIEELSRLNDLEIFTGKEQLSPLTGTEVTFDQILGMEREKKALALAVAGRHHTLIMGEPGTGKTVLITAASSLAPPLTTKEKLESSEFYSLAENSSTLIQAAPFRSPHHTSSDAAVIGGGAKPRPGEVTLAHNGFLFLDELIQFQTRTLQALREPLENRTVHIARAQEKVVYPADFTLLAASNPCQCGYLFSRSGRCNCSPIKRLSGIGKISGPFLDRISIELDVQKQTTLQAGSLSHTWYREKVLEIDERIRSRNGKRGNNSLNRAQLMEHLQGSAEHRLLEDLSRRFSLSPRGQIGTMQVARTLADWNGKDKIGEECLEEAFQYRSIRLLAMSVFSEAA